MVLRMLRVALPPVADEADEADVAAPLLDGQALALLQAVGGFQAYRRAVVGAAERRAGRALPAVRRAATRTPSPPRVEWLHDALTLADADPRRSPAGAARQPTERRPRLPRTRAGTRDGELVEICEIVQHELAHVDADVAERYFAGAAGPARGR